VLHHIAQHTTKGFLFCAFRDMGDLAVAVFFFISGYGLIKKLASDEKYLDTFVLKRTKSIIIPYIIVCGLYWMASLFEENPYSIEQVLLSLINGNPIVSNSWYIIVSILFYAVYYISAKIFIKTNWKCELVLLSEFVFCVLWVVICRKAGYGGWWYVTNFAFIIGMGWSVYEKHIMAFLSEKSHYIILTIVVVTLFFALLIANKSLEKSLISMATSTSFAIAVVLISCIVQINSHIWQFLGSISMEIYLMHGLTMNAFRGNLVYISSELLYTCMVVFVTILIAIPLHMLFQMIGKLQILKSS